MLKEPCQGGGTADTVDSKSAAFGRESSNLSPGTKTCIECEKDYPATRDFFQARNRRGRQGFKPRCKPCQKTWTDNYLARVEAEKAEVGADKVVHYLPAEPFREWIKSRMAFYYAQSYFEIGAGASEFSRRSGMSKRRINEVLKRSEQVTVELVDRVLIAEGSTMLWELYPELYE